MGKWFLGFACMARVNNASTNRVSCCDRVCLFGTPGKSIFANKNRCFGNSRRSFHERHGTLTAWLGRTTDDSTISSWPVAKKMAGLGVGVLPERKIFPKLQRRQEECAAGFGAHAKAERRRSFKAVEEEINRQLTCQQPLSSPRFPYFSLDFLRKNPGSTLAQTTRIMVCLVYQEERGSPETQ